MNDEQRAQIIANQKHAFSRGELTYEAGNLDVKTVTGWIGYTDLMTAPTMFGPAGKGVIVAVVIQDIEESMFDQEQLQVPFARVISMRAAPVIH